MMRVLKVLAVIAVLGGVAYFGRLAVTLANQPPTPEELAAAEEERQIWRELGELRRGDFVLVYGVPHKVTYSSREFANPAAAPSDRSRVMVAPIFPSSDYAPFEIGVEMFRGTRPRTAKLADRDAQGAMLVAYLRAADGHPDK